MYCSEILEDILMQLSRKNESKGPCISIIEMECENDPGKREGRDSAEGIIR